MARLAGQAKMLFYPIDPPVVDLILQHLKLEAKFPDRMHILDPCCGKGVAVKQLAEGLGIPNERVYAVELDRERSEEAKALMPGAHVLYASYLGTMITQYSFGIAYLNPPFDIEFGGGKREEELFLHRATAHLVPGGTLVFVLPYKALKKQSIVDWLDIHYEGIRVHKFPAEHRKYNECVVFATKRKVDLPADSVYSFGELRKQGWPYYAEDHRIENLGMPYMPLDQYGNTKKPEESVHVYEVRYSVRPHTFKPISMTEEEEQDWLRNSELNRLLTQPVVSPPKRPPLPPGKGHIAMMLAAGMLDGVVADETGVHVVRGTSTKEKYTSDVTITESDDGSVTERVTLSDRIVMTIRGVSQDGIIKDFSDRPQETGDEESSEETENGPGVVKVKPVSPAVAKAVADVTRAEMASEAASLVPSLVVAKDAARSWKAEFMGVGEDTFVSNGLRFAMHGDAERHARDLYARWTGAAEWRVVESYDEPNK